MKIEVCINDKWEECNTNEGFIKGIIDENTGCFCLTIDTPLMIGELCEDLVLIRNIEAAEEVLQCCYIPPDDTDEYTCKLLSMVLEFSSLVRGEKISVQLPKATSSSTRKGAEREHHHQSLDFTLDTGRLVS